MLKTLSATIALLALANPALAAGCATPSEAAALKTAVIQQELMVAALQCHETAAYNRFVMNYRGELQASDATLKSFFVRRGGEHGESGYDTFKTKAANLSALEQARNAGGFCADAHALFAAAFAHQGSLMSFVESRAGQTDIGGICAESRPVLAKSETVPVAGASTVKIAAAPPPETAVGGVPVHSRPAIPYRPATAAPAPRAREDAASNDDEEEDLAYADDEALPPPLPRPRYDDIRERGYDSYAPRSYGPPPNWQQGWGQQAWRDYPPAPPPPGYWYRRGW
jgi:hypothetical protein